MRIESRWGLPSAWAAAISSPAVSTAATTAQILPESPGRQRPTTETAAAAGEKVIETPGASAKSRWLLRRPMRTADPSGPFRKNQNWNRSTQVLLSYQKSLLTTKCAKTAKSILNRDPAIGGVGHPMKLYVFLWESAASDRDDLGWKPLPQGRHVITDQDGAARHNLLFRESSP